MRLTLLPWTGLDDIQFAFDELILLRCFDNYYVPLTMNNGYFTLINYFGRDSPRADLLRSTTSNGQVTSVIGLSSTTSSDRQLSSVIVYGVCSRVFLVIHADWVSNSALFDLNLAISNICYFDSLSNRGFIILIMINNIWWTLTIIDNLTSYKCNRNIDSFVTLEESVERWRRGKIPKIYFLLQCENIINITINNNVKIMIENRCLKLN